jgi:hypothetical protein
MANTSPGAQLVILAATANRFRAEDRSDSRFYVEGRLTNGVLSCEIVARLQTGERGTVSGKQLLAALIAHFGVGNLSAIKGVWIGGIDLDTNIDQFNQLTGPGGLPEVEAAKRTWTGQRANEYGFANASIQMLVGSPGAYTDVVVLFTR